MIRIKRVYEPASPDDGVRVLVDRLWPRGLSRERARVDEWLEDVAPSDELRKWYRHDPDKWPDFKKRYFAELDAQPQAVRRLKALARDADLSLLFGSKEERFNNARALLEYLQARGRKR